MGRISGKLKKTAVMLAAAGAILLVSPFTAAANQQKTGPGIELDRETERQQEAETAQEAESLGQAQESPEIENQEQVQTEELPEIKTVYQAFMAGSGWSEEYGDNFECAKAGDYLTGLKATLQGQPEGMSGTLTYQVNVSGSGWQPWVENMAETGSTEGGAALEAVKMELTGELKENYDIYYMVYQNGAWTDWAANGNPAGQEGVGLRADGIRMSVTKKGQTPPAEPEKIPGPVLPAGVDPNRPMVALTFDDGPKASVTNRILNSLEACGGRATFFMVGTNINQGTAPTIQRMVSLN